MKTREHDATRFSRVMILRSDSDPESDFVSTGQTLESSDYAHTRLPAVMTTSAILSLNPPLTAASLIGLSRDEIINQSTLLITSLTTPPPSAWSKSSTTYNTSSFPTVARSSSSKPNRKVPGTGMTDRYKWHSRTSEHKPVTGQTVAQLYDAFRSGLLLEHSRHEQEYIQSCSKAELLQVVPPGVLEGE